MNVEITKVFWYNRCVKLTYKIWDKTKEKYVDSIDFSDGETLFLAVTPDGRLIQYGNYTDHRVGEVHNPENFEILSTAPADCSQNLE